MCDLYIIYMYAYILFATCLFAGILRKLLYIYITEEFLASTFFCEKPFGGIVANSLWRDIFSKTLLNENYSKTPLQPKTNKPSNGMDYVFSPRVFDKVESRWSLN